MFEMHWCKSVVNGQSLKRFKSACCTKLITNLQTRLHTVGKSSKKSHWRATEASQVYIQFNFEFFASKQLTTLAFLARKFNSSNIRSIFYWAKYFLARKFKLSSATVDSGYFESRKKSGHKSFCNSRLKILSTHFFLSFFQNKFRHKGQVEFWLVENHL